jgi:hypothetical protein
MDSLELPLFADIDLGLRDPAGSGCAAPLGRRRRIPRPQPALRPFRRSSPALLMLAAIRRRQDDGFTELGLSLDQLTAEGGRNTTATATLADAVDQLRVRLTAVERAVGVVERPMAPHPTRRHPGP